METRVFESGQASITEISGAGVLFKTASEIVQTLMDLSWGGGSSKIIMHRQNLPPEFFYLKTGLAGEVLQKAATYRIQIAIVGDFSHVQSEALRAFIIECNRGRQTFFVADVAAARTALS